MIKRIVSSPLIWWALVIPLALGGVRAASLVTKPSQRAAGSPQPVKKQTVTDAALRAAAREIQILGFNFQEIYYGFEGPNYTRSDREPTRGEVLLAEAAVFGVELIATARFELIDEGGRVIETLRFVKRDTANDDGAFAGAVHVPARPFRVAVSGTDVTGAPYRHVYERLFRPTPDKHAAPRMPPGLPPGEEAGIRRLLAEQDAETKARFEREARKHPQGLIVLPRMEVSDVTYEPLLSDGAKPLGMRLRYSVRVSEDGYYRLDPYVTPVYTLNSLRGKVRLKVIEGDISPRPEGMTGGAAEVLRFGVARYKAGTTYCIVADLIPDFAIRNAAKTRFCITRSRFGETAEIVWRRLTTDESPVRYSVAVRGTDFSGETGDFFPPGVFYRSLRAEGAGECAAGGNVNF